MYHTDSVDLKSKHVCADPPNIIILTRSTIIGEFLLIFPHAYIETIAKGGFHHL